MPDTLRTIPVFAAGIKCQHHFLGPTRRASTATQVRAHVAELRITAADPSPTTSAQL